MSDDVTQPPGAPPPFAPPPFAPPPFAPPSSPPPAEALPAAQLPAALLRAPDSLPARRGRPVLGASLWIVGALLWAYVVIGEWVLQFDFPEAVGALVVLATYAVAWLSSVRDLTTPADRWRRWIPGVVALGLFLVTLLLVTLLFGTSRRSHWTATTVLLWFFSAAVYVLGRYVTARSHLPRTRSRTAASVVLWLLSGSATLVSMVSILSRG